MAQHGAKGANGTAGMTARAVASPCAVQPAPVIADKLYFRIGEVASLCDVPAYVLRFWESEFPQLKPNKGGTGQRLYRRRDVEMALRIKTLLYDEGFTIPGARQLLKTERQQKEPQLTLAIASEETVVPSSENRRALLRLQKEMRDLLNLLSATPSNTVHSIRTTRAPRPTRPVPPGSDNLFG